MTKVVLCRHGHVEGISPERFRGRAELPLTKQGRIEAQLLAARIAEGFKPVAIYTSPMGRCIETGRAIGEAFKINPQTLEALNDIDYGAWQGKTHSEIERSEPQNYALWYSAPHWVHFAGGESLQELASRCADVLRMIWKQHPGDTVVLVGHDSVNRIMLLHCLGLPLSAYWRLAQNPCCINEFDLQPEKIVIRRINETHHLERGVLG